MKIALRKIKPNPFRDLRAFPLDTTKVNHLVNSMDATGYWDNVLVRETDDGYEAAYGHHRLAALRKWKGPEASAEFIVHDLDDTTMLRCMGEENLSDWAITMGHQSETIRAVIEAARAGRVTLPPVPDGRGSQSVRALRVSVPRGGADTIYFTAKSLAEFMGGNWGQQRCSEALAYLDSIGTFSEKSAFNEKQKEILNRQSVTKAADVIAAVKKTREEVEKRHGKGTKASEERVQAATNKVMDELTNERLGHRKAVATALRAAGVRKTTIPEIDTFAITYRKTVLALFNGDDLDRKGRALAANAAHIEASIKTTLVKSLTSLSGRVSDLAARMDRVPGAVKTERKQLSN